MSHLADAIVEFERMTALWEDEIRQYRAATLKYGDGFIMFGVVPSFAVDRLERARVIHQALVVYQQLVPER